jgi:hypothetical protein
VLEDRAKRHEIERAGVILSILHAGECQSVRSDTAPDCAVAKRRRGLEPVNLEASAVHCCHGLPEPRTDVERSGRLGARPQTPKRADGDGSGIVHG